MRSTVQHATSGLGPTGVGLGLRWEFLEQVLQGPPIDVAFFEVSPENYMRRGGYYPAALEALKERYAFVTHGLTLSLGAADPPSASYLSELDAEITRLGSPWHSDHLCFSSAGSLVLHELLPLKHSRANATRVADRLRAVEDRLGVPMAVENISYYAHPGAPEMPETEFIRQVLDQSGCGLLLDVNNVYVNAQNHGFDARQFILDLPLERVVQLHVAGHSPSAWDPELMIDTHGAPVCDPVLDLLELAISHIGPVAVLLERDNAIPELPELLAEVSQLRARYSAGLERFQGLHAIPA
ncbi:MAG TPA: DUF692 domain-containing protein [Polyangiaceae bacterium]